MVMGLLPPAVFSVLTGYPTKRCVRQQQTVGNSFLHVRRRANRQRVIHSFGMAQGGATEISSLRLGEPNTTQGCFASSAYQNILQRMQQSLIPFRARGGGGGGELMEWNGLNKWNGMEWNGMEEMEGWKRT